MEQFRRMTHPPIAAIWRSIEARLQTLGPDLVPRLGVGLAPAEIAAFERELGVGLPSDYAASLREHAGSLTAVSATDRPFAEMLFCDFILLPPAVVLAERAWLTAGYRRDASPSARIAQGLQNAHYHAGWIPVVAADEDRAVYLCIDTCPTSDGQLGQIISLATSHIDRSIAAPSFGDLLQSFLTRLETAEIDEELLADDGVISLMD